MRDGVCTTWKATKRCAPAKRRKASRGWTIFAPMRPCRRRWPSISIWYAAAAQGAIRVPLIAALSLRETDRLIAIERHADEARALTAVLARFRNAKVACADGYARLPALLPPPERRGLVVLDPPYEAPDEFARVAAALAAARRRFATGIYLLWFPAKSPAAADALCGEVLAGGANGALRITIDAGARSAGQDGKERLTAAGLLVVNPPFGLAGEMHAVAAILAPRLGYLPQSPACISVTQF